MPVGGTTTHRPEMTYTPNMAMVCTQCKTSYQQRLHCPQCGAHLHYQASRRGAGLPGQPGQEDSWEQTPWGRLVVGVLLAQGLYYVLRQLCTAGLLAAHEESAVSVWPTFTGLIIIQCLQAAGIFAAGVLTGAGQRRGFLFGAVVGVWNGVFFILAQYWTGRPLTVINLFGEPILQVAFGAAGGLAGSLIWMPMAAPSLPAELSPPVPLAPRRRIPPAFAGPIAWTRVFTGMALAVGGVIWVDVIREFVLDASEGRLRIDTHLQAELVTWEIAALALFCGGALAGATTKNGLKQGLAVGIGASTVLLGVRMASTHVQPHFLLLTLTTALCFGIVGGWFGGQLLPPIIGPLRRKRIHTVTS